MSLNGLFGIFDYLIYLVQSTNRHGVHSPFVYSFADKVLYGKQHCLYEPAAELCRKRMIQSKKRILFNGKSESLGSIIFRNAPSAKYNRILFRWVQYQQLGNHIVEFGSTLGVLPLYLQRGDSAVNRYHIFEKSDSLQEITKYNLNEYECNETIRVLPYTRATDATRLLQEQDVVDIDLLIINQAMDADEFWHLIEWAIPRLRSNGSIVFNRLNETPESQLRWNQLQNLDEITVSIDLFGMGMAFARKEQIKESFLLRY
jgi:precorrin-6B methylase 2